MMQEPSIMQPIIQYGFAGFSAVLLGVLIWMIKNLLIVLKDSSQVIINNTKAIHTLDATTKEVKESINETRHEVILMKQEMIRKPCGENLK